MTGCGRKFLNQMTVTFQAEGRGHTKETGNLNATAISKNFYQTELNTWN
jgi:hypothetical protein